MNEALDWLWSDEAKQTYPDYNERWKAAVRKSMEPLFEKAIQNKLWFYAAIEDDEFGLTQGGYEWSPKELKELQDRGIALWWPSTFTLFDPYQKLADLQAAADKYRTEILARSQD